MNQKVVVIGAGWAGLSCAHHLLDLGKQVVLIDAAPVPGGRARSSVIRLNGQPVEVDNGQHLLIGGYRQTLALIEYCRTSALLKRLPLQFCSDSIHIARRGPGRLGLVWGVLTGRGLTVSDRMALLRAGITFTKNRWAGFEGRTVAQLLTMTGQPAGLIQAIWRPLCVAALNTEPEQACGQTFVNVIHDALVIDGHSSDFLVSSAPLGQLVPEPLLRDMEQRGLNWKSRVRADAVSTDAAARWEVRCSDEIVQCDALVLATPSHTTSALLANVAPQASAILKTFRPEPIRTVYIAWPASAAMRMPQLTMLSEIRSAGWHGQWLFSRGTCQGLRIAAVVVSAAGLVTSDNATVADNVVAQVCNQLGFERPLDAVCINEKRATFLCTPDRPVVSSTHVNAIALPPNIMLAGDYCLHRYPATIEAATVSGRQAAQDLCATLIGPE